MLASYTVRHLAFAWDEAGRHDEAWRDFEESVELRRADGVLPGVAPPGSTGGQGGDWRAGGALAVRPLCWHAGAVGPTAIETTKTAEQLAATARALVPPGRRILAADESHPSIARRFEPLGIPNTAESRRRYRQMLFTTPGVGEYVSGVILHDETIRQQADDGTPLVEVLGRETAGTRPTWSAPSRSQPADPANRSVGGRWPARSCWRCRPVGATGRIKPDDVKTDQRVDRGG